MKLGAHISIAGGLYKAADKAYLIGAQVLQIFGSSPQSFKIAPYTKDDFEEFKAHLTWNRLGPVFFHGVYLINLASSSSPLYRLSIESLIYYLNLCEKVGAGGVIFHIGSHRGTGFPKVKNRVVEAIKEVLARTDKGKLILENNAGQGGGIGSNFKEIGEILKEVDPKRVSVCLDTQHAFAAGYSIHTPEGLNKTLKEFDDQIGLGRLIVIHLNDSKTPLGSFKDRHENIGEGLIGRFGIGNVLNHPKLSNLSFIIETPGFDDKGPDKKNLDILKSLEYPST